MHHMSPPLIPVSGPSLRGNADRMGEGSPRIRLSHHILYLALNHKALFKTVFAMISSDGKVTLSATDKGDSRKSNIVDAKDMMQK